MVSLEALLSPRRGEKPTGGTSDSKDRIGKRNLDRKEDKKPDGHASE